MTLDTITVRGVLAFRDQVTLDLREIPPGLIAVVGANGEGKSTLMETPIGAIWRELPSRRDKPLVDYAHDRNSLLEVSFEIAGRGVYSARVSLDGVSRGSDAVMLHTGPDGAQTVLTDGKVSTFDAWVAAHMPPLEMVLASAFSAQQTRCASARSRKGSFSSLDRKERKELFADLLGLSRWESMATAARTAAGLVEQTRGRLIVVRDVLSRETTPAIGQALHDRRTHLETERADLATTRVDLEARGAALETAHAEAQQAALDAEQALSRRRQAESDLARCAGVVDDLAAQIARLQTDHAADIQVRDAQAETRQQLLLQQHEDLGPRLQVELDQIDASMTTEIATLARQIDEQRAALRTRIANNEALLADRQVVLDAVAEVARLEPAIAALRTEQQQLVQQQEAAREAGRGLDRRLDRLTQVVAPERQRAQAAAGLIDTVPCHGEAAFAGCRFLTEAAAARTRIPALDEELAGEATIRAAVDALVARVAPITDRLDVVAAQCQQQETARAAARVTAARHAHLQVAEDRLADRRRQLAELDVTAAAQRQQIEARAADQRAQADTRCSTRRAELWAEMGAARDAAAAARASAIERYQTRSADLRARETEAVMQRETARAALDALPDTLPDVAALRQQVGAMAAQLQTHRVAWDDNTARRAAVDRDLEALRRDVDAYEQRQARLDRVAAAVTTLDDRLLVWQLLARILGRDGLPTLEIANAGPTVSALTNDLLQACFSGRFTLELVTEQPKRDGKGMREVFEVKVLDNEKGGNARDLSDLSGGEQIVVDECLKSALAILVNQRSPMPIRTIWRDETTGPLDPVNADRYLVMLRRLRELAGAHHLIFVTHSADAAAQADAQIQVGGGTARIVLPPFGESITEAA